MARTPKKTSVFPRIKIERMQKHELVEIPIPANTSADKYMIPDQPNLRNVHVMDVVAYYDDILTNAPSGDLPIDYDVFRKGYLTLQLFNGKEFCHERPLMEMCSYLGSSDPDDRRVSNMKPKDFNYQKVNWTKSYVQFPGLAISESARTLILSVYYCDIVSIEKSDATFEFNTKME